ncbi:cytochrome Bc1 complex with Stigmatellin [Hanseniaspora valbyensis NRRL Y-1626]|uniref:Cytochrome b-c1 complex subunit 2, mitochondrial n=1 Tax=Hanseniaspora valbyensis NRRL Y-1626 TaxID=766949 RepID=A0A1B7THJ1_9ASCO|nr:cytochrome Bc1 complex with Stigmatellin [Hanseniaspora valbyensis NRRL Y-1626]
MLSNTLKRAYSAAAAATPAPVASTNVSSLTLKLVNKTGSGKKQGLPHLLSRYNFLDTESKSGLRIVRESEVLGGKFSSTPLRDGSIELKATFLKENLPYYLEILNSVVSKPVFKKYHFDEEVLPAVLNDALESSQDVELKAKDLLYQLTFKNAVLGQPVAYDQVDKVNFEEVKKFASELYQPSNAILTAENVDAAAFKQFVAEAEFLSAASKAKPSAASTTIKSFVGESGALRYASSEDVSTAAISVPVAEKDFATYETLKNYLQSPLFKFNKKVSKVELDTYSDKKIGVFTLYSTGASPAAGIKSIVKALKEGVDVSGAANYTEAFSGVKSTAKTFKLDKFNYVAVGKTTELPTVNEL